MPKKKVWKIEEDRMNRKLLSLYTLLMAVLFLSGCAKGENETNYREVIDFRKHASIEVQLWTEDDFLSLKRTNFDEEYKEAFSDCIRLESVHYVYDHKQRKYIEKDTNYTLMCSESKESLIVLFKEKGIKPVYFQLIGEVSSSQAMVEVRF